MEKRIKRETVKEKGCFYFKNGYHCAEAVTAAALDEMGQDVAQAVAHATAFGGGFGKSFNEACGALSGALIVIGHHYARTSQGESWDEAAELASTIRDIFIEKFGTTHCGTLRERFGEEQPDHCARLTGEMAAALVDLLQDREN